MSEFQMELAEFVKCQCLDDFFPNGLRRRSGTIVEFQSRGNMIGSGRRVMKEGAA